MATHSSIHAWKIPWTEEPGGLQPMGSHRVGRDWSNLAAAAAATLPDGVENCASIIAVRESSDINAHQWAD